jgi:Fic family protein
MVKWYTMMTYTGFDPFIPFDHLPPVPPSRELFETTAILKQEAVSRAALAELKGYAHIIPNQEILINAIVLREAKDSSEIENIVTTQDELYRAITLKSQQRVDPAAKEVVSYREALWHGYDVLKNKGFLSTNDVASIQRIIVGNDAGIRKQPGTALVNDVTGEVVYTPPQDENRIRELMQNFAEYMNGGDDSLTKAAILHYQFETIHPFYDGNGRTGRIVNVLYLILKGYLDIPILYLSSYFIETKPDYYRYLRTVTSEGQWEAWIRYFLLGIEKTAKNTIAEIRRIKELLDRTIDMVREKAARIYSKELVEALFEHPYCKNEIIERKTGVERKAASRYLHTLSELGILELRKIGRENIFINTELMNLLRERR